MKRPSLTKNILRSTLIQDGSIETFDGCYLKAFEFEPMASGKLEDGFEGPISDSFYQKLTELLSRLPDHFNGQILMFRSREELESNSLTTQLIALELVKKPESYSHLEAILSEIGANPTPLTGSTWKKYVTSLFGSSVDENKLPDLIWEKDCLRTSKESIRVLSLTELPQVTWNACFQAIYEAQCEFCISLKMSVPDRKKIKRQLETKRRVSHALSITSSLEVKNIESNSVLGSSEETLERILVGKESLLEISIGLILSGDETNTKNISNDFERVISGIGNAGLYPESIGTLPVLRGHLPGEPMLGIRKLPILSSNLAHIFPLLQDFSRSNDQSFLPLKSRSNEVSHLNLFSKENLNFNSFICGASGSGKSFLMNAILSSLLKDEPKTRLCVFDIGGSYRRIIESHKGVNQTLSSSQAHSLLAGYLRSKKIDGSGFYRLFIETLCGSGSHVTHSHRVAIDDILRQNEGTFLTIKNLIKSASSKNERFYLDVAHWLKPHLKIDEANTDTDLHPSLSSQVTAFDFKELDSDPVLQRTTILLLSEMLWNDLTKGSYPRTLIVFDEVWRFFAQSKTFLEEMYRTLRKYRAGIVSITQNLADYGDESFAKMIFTNSFTKIFLQNGAAAEFLRETFDLPESDIRRALSVTSKKPCYSEFFALSPTLSQVYRLYPTEEFYRLANTENISSGKDAV